MLTQTRVSPYMDNDIEVIYQSALKFLVPLTPQETYETIVVEALRLVRAEEGSIFLETNGELERVYTTSPTLTQIQPRKRGFTYRVFATNTPKILSKAEIQKIHPEIGGMRAHADILVPLSYKDQPIGVLTVLTSSKDSFTQRDVEILKLFGPLATLAIRKTQLYDETRQALETRDLFISMASHELRTPLTTIYAYMQLMQIKVVNNESLEPKWMDALLKETVRLTKLVNELLQVDQIKTGELKYTWRKCSLADIVNQAVANFQIILPDYMVVVQNKLPLLSDIIRADFDKLLRVVTNLLINAAKYSQKRSTITLRLDRKGDDVTLKVKDFGKGITKDDLPKIFEGFYRGMNSKHEGMGLGLYLSRQIVEGHNGSIQVNSKVNKGTTVEIALPAA